MRSERAALMAQAVKNPAEKQEIQEMVVQSLRREDPLVNVRRMTRMTLYGMSSVTL